jgi:hypothetical protein
MSKDETQTGSELSERLGDDETMGPEHHEFCNMRLVGRDCDCGLDDLYRLVDDLAMVIRRFVHAIRKNDPDNEMAQQAMDYLKRKNLQGSILR